MSKLLAVFLGLVISFVVCAEDVVVDCDMYVATDAKTMTTFDSGDIQHMLVCSSIYEGMATAFKSQADDIRSILDQKKGKVGRNEHRTLMMLLLQAETESMQFVGLRDGIQQTYETVIQQLDADASLQGKEMARF